MFLIYGYGRMKPASHRRTTPYELVLQGHPTTTRRQAVRSSQAARKSNICISSEHGFSWGGIGGRGSVLLKYPVLIINCELCFSKIACMIRVAASSVSVPAGVVVRSLLINIRSSRPFNRSFALFVSCSMLRIRDRSCKKNRFLRQSIER
jgi:hypothetical protein